MTTMKLLLLLTALTCNAAITPSFLTAVEQIESRGVSSAVGDNGRARGSFQFWKGTWDDCSKIRRAHGLAVYPYSQATNPHISRLYAGSWFAHLESRLSLEMKRMPTDAQIYAAFNTGYRGFKKRGFDLRKVPKTTKKALARL